MRGAALFDRTAVSVSGGLLAAIPVVAVFGGSVAGSDPIAAATMGAGAMLVGIAWRVGGGRPPRALMATDAAVMALSTFVGAATGSLPALHLAMLFVWAFASGLVVAVGRRGAVVGTQALIAFVVFGRFSQPVAPALGLAALVLAGGLAEVLFVSVIRWPLPLRIQRNAVGHAYRALGALAVAPVAASAIPAASSLDEAELTVSSPTLFGDPTIVRLRSLIDEGRRVRLELSGIRAMLKQLGDPAADGAYDVAGSSARPLLEQVSRGLDQVGAAVEGDTQASAEFAHTVSQLSSSAEALSHAASREVSRSLERVSHDADPRRRDAGPHLAAILSACRAIARDRRAGRSGRSERETR